MEKQQHEILPILPLRDVVIYPHMVIPLFVGRTKSIKAVEQAMSSGKQLFLVTQKEPEKEVPDIKDVYEVGAIAAILQLLRLPDGTVKVLVEGIERGRMKNVREQDETFFAEIEQLPDIGQVDHDTQILIRSLLNAFEEYVKLNKRIPPEILTALAGIEDAGRLADTVSAHLALKLEEKQKVLETQNTKDRLQLVMEYLEAEIEMLQVDIKVENNVKRQMEKSQREYYLNEKMKAIQKEIGESEDGLSPAAELDKLKKQIKKVGMSEEAEEKAMTEFNKLRMMPPMSAEATVTRNFLDWLINLPWKKASKMNHDLDIASKILEADHYGLEKVKERILEFLAVQQRVDKIKGPILCLVGPPGVGKTSLGQSIARATGREFVRVALGGVRDEAEIRGHRRTYIGSMPGKILQRMTKAKVRNPLFMLDEVDKMAADFRGDPASALLEVLDPEQNHAFNDHYLEVDYDLSDVMFVTTANSLDIPPPLLDRMEVLRLAGYTEDEKLNIAVRYLVPKQLEANGTKKSELTFTEEAIRAIIRYYTREAGVRNLEREISKICRKVVHGILTKKKAEKVNITAKNLEEFLGVKQFRFGLAEEFDQVGQVTGLAWTEVGGDLLTIEVAAVEGKGKAIYTGHLGEIMTESIQAAMTVVRSRSKKLGIDPKFYEKNDIHVHVPEGATPKDGPSAGVGMCTALVSALTNISVHANVAMTGEITLRGEILPIGGLKEKLLAALRGGIKTVVIPKENEKDLKELPKNLVKSLDIRPVRWIEDVLKLSLQRMPGQKTEDKGRKTVSKVKAKPKAKKSI